MKQPNILFIISDQHNCRAMGWTGLTPARTPNMDRLAGEGTAFTSAITPNPVCGPARYCLYSGQYSSTNGVLINEAPPRPFVPLAEQLREKGYATANVGKLHATPFHERLGFDYCLNHEFFINPAGISHYDAFLRHELEKRNLPHQGFGPKGIEGRSWLQNPEQIAFRNWVPEDLTAERWTTNESLRFIREHQNANPDQPFFLHASYFPPHHPFAPVEKYLNQIPEDLPLPQNFAVASPRHGEAVDFSEDEYRRMMRYYYAFLLQLDDAIGHLLDGLDAMGLADDTIVVYTSDHGDMIGEHRMLYKGLMYEGSVGVPLIVRGPGIEAGVQATTPVSLLDLPPTFMEAAGSVAPEQMEGRSLWPSLQGGVLEPEPVYSEFFTPYENTESRLEPRYLMVRDGPLKLIRNHPWLGIDTEELYDLSDDPWEMNNRIKDTKFEQQRNRLQFHLDSFSSTQKAKLPMDSPMPSPRDPYQLPWPADPYEDAARYIASSENVN